MADAEKTSWADYRPSKKVWFWSMAGACVATIIVGFGWGGWSTAGSARTMTALAVRDARADLVANICVHNFATAADAQDNLEALRAKSSWAREGFIQEGGWATIAGIEEPVVNAADVCAQHLIDMKQLPSDDTAGVTSS